MSDTMRNSLIGVGVALLMLVVGGASFMIARDAPDESNPVDAAGAATSTTTTASTTTAAPASAAPELLASTSTTSEPPIREFDELFELARPAVASVTGVACDTTRQGTAFLVSDTVVYTNAWVIEDVAEVVVAIDGQSIEAAVLGRDPERNIAALELSEPVTGIEPLVFSTSAARVGVEVAAIVQPVALPQTLTVGRVTSIDATQPASLVRTDAGVMIGSGGGPMIDQRGQVVGIVSVSIDDDGIASGPLTAVSGVDVRDQLAAWIKTPEPPTETFCVGGADLSQIDDVAGELIAADTDHPQMAALQRTYAVYTQSINSSRAENAYDLLGPAITATGDRTEWADAQRTSKLWDWRIREVVDTTNGLQVRSVFTSTQDSEFGFDGQSTCTRWDVTHNVISGQFRGESYWLINRSRATEGSGPVDCLDWTPERITREVLTVEPNAVLRRSDLLAGGTVHEWRIDVGSASQGNVGDNTDGSDNADNNDEAVDTADEPVVDDGTATDVVSGPLPVTLTVQVDSLGGFDPFIEIFNEAGELIEENNDVADGNINSELTITISTPEVMTVVVHDVTDRSGGEYSVTFTTRS